MVQCQWTEVEIWLAERGYQFCHRIASGSFGTVWKAVRDVDGVPVALKIVDLRNLTNNDHEHLREEVEILSSLCHPNIVQVHEILRVQDYVVLVMEYLPGGDLFDRLQNGRMKEREVIHIAVQILSALAYLHQCGIAHRDIKLENIVFSSLPSDGEQTVKLVDFGFACRFWPGAKGTQRCGTLMYISPQIARSEEYNPFKVDMWSVGVMVYAMVTSTLPFHETGAAETLERIARGIAGFQEKQWRECSPELVDIVKSLLSDPEMERPSALVAHFKLEKLLRNCAEREEQWMSQKQLSVSKILGLMQQMVW
mmetsp:Transcript_4973/g.10033  ORF Transcript_4973/g.10033 Transcript_4973/m.10033 type:complete len:310 (-) Transcript_4973:314-1243(-)|eukprot:CAMPEP_0184683852 /NCGR_PEP_ID=MMETSP0312-20130426/12861_1 /TAXON_ID=31354 /ORGANISM="Compsopogon coeruleus, Strain SAG 36.94" /LENGTH=309 /DNA_ID=CAMNT_0027136519 /DNA_START=51 /DNA_END=980 /DNA_ORIENTATION=-